MFFTANPLGFDPNRAKNQRLAVVSHQCEALYITKEELFASHQAAREYTCGDDMRLAAMIYTLKRDDIPRPLRLG